MNMKPATVVALVVGLALGSTAGFVLGHRNAERDLQAMAFINAVGRISTSGTTLRLIEQGRAGNASTQHEMMLKSAVRDAARYGAGGLPKIPGSIQNLRRSLAESEAYAVRRNWSDVAAQLRDIQKVLATPGTNRT
jgi:hypothetical protein